MSTTDLRPSVTPQPVTVRGTLRHTTCDVLVTDQGASYALSGTYPPIETPQSGKPLTEYEVTGSVDPAALAACPGYSVLFVSSVKPVN